MALPQPIGIKIWGAILVLFGGFFSLITILEAFESIRFYGLESMMVMTPASFAGFLVYGLTPIAMYATGVGLFTSRPWARSMMVLPLPALLGLFFLNQAIHVANLLTEYPLPIIELFFRHLNVFTNFFLAYLVISIPMFLYFSQSGIKAFFSLQTTTKS